MPGKARKGQMQLGRRSNALITTTIPTATARSRSQLVVAAASLSAVPIKIQVEYRAEFGQVLKVVGAGEVLGEWDPKHAPGKLFFFEFFLIHFNFSR
jgi:hypothetical protein